LDSEHASSLVAGDKPSDPPTFISPPSISSFISPQPHGVPDWSDHQLPFIDRLSFVRRNDLPSVSVDVRLRLARLDPGNFYSHQAYGIRSVLEAETVCVSFHFWCSAMMIWSEKSAGSGRRPGTIRADESVNCRPPGGSQTVLRLQESLQNLCPTAKSPATKIGTVQRLERRDCAA
jgi:hypothetical protein